MAQDSPERERVCSSVAQHCCDNAPLKSAYGAPFKIQINGIYNTLGGEKCGSVNMHLLSLGLWDPGG